MSKIILIALLLAFAGCSETHHMTECRGSFAPANPGKWQPTDADLQK